MCGKDEMLHDLRDAERAALGQPAWLLCSHDLERSVVIAARQYVREGARLAASDPFEDALVQRVEQFERSIAMRTGLSIREVQAMRDLTPLAAGYPTPAGPSGRSEHG